MSSKTITSAQSLSDSHSSTFSTKPSPTSFSFWLFVNIFTSCPALVSCQARSVESASIETKRNLVTGTRDTVGPNNDYRAGSKPSTHGQNFSDQSSAGGGDLVGRPRFELGT